MTEPVAQGLGVTRRFGRMTAVDAVDIQVGAGEVVGLLGANGAGKTTLIRLLLGLLRASSGTVLLFGKPPSRETRRRLGYVPQGLGLYEDLSPAENLAFARAAFGEGDAAVPAELATSAAVPVGRLPLGVQRRLAFVQALAHRPDLLILDEPTSGVDPLARARLWDTIRAAADAGAGVLVTTHSMDEAEQCDRLVVMANGRMVAEGSVPEIVGNSRVTVVETAQWARAFSLLEDSGQLVALVGRTLRVPGRTRQEVSGLLDGLPVRLQDAPATLEERFLQLTLAGDQPAER
jgi:ABC-2 type transport system ATP-binding protein/ribosome-dependent ATPase